MHVSAFAAAAGLGDDAVRATTRPGDTGEAPLDDALVLRLVDELHDTGGVTDATWTELAERYEEKELLEMLTVAGFYHLISSHLISSHLISSHLISSHLISFVVNGARIEPEPWAATFPAISKG